MASFQAKINWKMQRREKIKIIISFRSFLTHNLKFQKNCNKNKKLKNASMATFKSQNMLEKAEKKRKDKLAFRFVPTQRVIENSKKIAKKFKKI